MLDEIKNIESKKSDLKSFGVTISIILLTISGLLFWKENDSFQVFFLIGGALFISGMFIPTLLKPAYWIWMIFAVILGWVMTRIILILLFYIILTPIGLISRLFGKSFLELRFDKSKKSHWNLRDNKQLKKEDYEKQF